MSQAQKHSPGAARRWSSPSGQVLLVSALVSLLLLTGCDDPAANDMCTQYEQVATRADEIKDIEPTSMSVEDLRKELKSFQVSLDQLQAAADGRLDAAISDVRTAVRELVQAAVDAGKEAVETAQPLLDESLGEVDKRWAALREKADAECDVSAP
jgi:chromosome segregation ATPase